MPTLHRRAWWRETVAAYRQSGLTAKAFAETAGVNPSTLWWWAKQLRRETNAVQLVRVQVVEPSPVLASQPRELFATVGPAELRFCSDVAPAYLGELVAAIARATRC